MLARTRARWWIVAGLVFAGVGATAREASACSPPLLCPRGYVLPAMEVPANVPALYFGTTYAPYRGVTPTTLLGLTLHRMDDGGESEVAGMVTDSTSGARLFGSNEPLVPGAMYELRGQLTCTGSTAPGEIVRASFRTTSAAPMPTSLGTLAAGAVSEGDISVFPGRTASINACGQMFFARYVDVSLSLSEDARPWGDLFLYSTYVDGEPWRKFEHGASEYQLDASWTGRGRDRIYVACGQARSPFFPNDRPVPGVTEGVHRVELRATLPGSTAVVATSAIEVELRCPVVVPDGGVADASGADAASTPDAASGMDAAGGDAGAGVPGARPAFAGRGGCNAGANGGRVSVAWLAAGVAVLAGARRRRRTG